MYLKEIQIQGFKSFADKAVVKFPTGIAAITSATGNGKSQVIDAIRWALGEQSAKTIKVDKIANVIFDGSEQRKPLGFAEVKLTFDNYDKCLPIVDTEVSIIRRVYRFGGSEYLINRLPCRLKDIIELFHDTGIGKNGHFIISPIEIDTILGKNTKDRRAFFDEATGIMKYKVRKDEALKKLEKVDENLSRIESILSEIDKSKGFIANQSEVSMDEYTKTKERYDLMNTIKTDMETSRKRLIDSISEMTKCMHGQFIDNIKHINENFIKYYSELIGDGTAIINLIDDKNPLGSDIEILIQQHGKDQQKATTLSGKDRYLVVTALQFAISATRATPICIFDQFDTTLDAQDVSKIINCIKELSKRQQFILSTGESTAINTSKYVHEIIQPEAGLHSVINKHELEMDII